MATGNKTTTAKKMSSKSNRKNIVTDKKRTETKSQNKSPSVKAGQSRNTEKQKPKFSFEGR